MADKGEHQGAEKLGPVDADGTRKKKSRKFNRAERRQVANSNPRKSILA